MDSEDFKAMLVTERMQMHYGEFRKENRQNRQRSIGKIRSNVHLSVS